MWHAVLLYLVHVQCNLIFPKGGDLNSQQASVRNNIAIGCIMKILKWYKLLEAKSRATEDHGINYCMEIIKINYKKIVVKIKDVDVIRLCL